jgi:hypothetical protein
MQPPVWRTLISFSRSKFVQSSLVWVALVPVVARFTEGMDKTFHVRIGENVHVLTLAPPFTWSMFFFGALFFMLGNFIVNWKAPRILKETGHFREFADQGRSPFELLDLARSLTASGKLTDALLTQTRNVLESVNVRIASSGVSADGIAPAVAQAYEIVANEIGAIFQDPLTSLNPLYTVGRQLVETIQAHLPVSGDEARRRAIGLLEGPRGAARRCSRC